MRVVIKIGTSTLAHPTGHLNIRRTEQLCKIISDIKNAGHQVILVSSGAIAVGRQVIGFHHRPTKVSEKQACAAIGQAQLMMIYQKLFAEYNHVASQILITKNTMLNPISRENAQNTFEELFRLGIIPIVNENDNKNQIIIEQIKITLPALFINDITLSNTSFNTYLGLGILFSK